MKLASFTQSIQLSFALYGCIYKLFPIFKKKECLVRSRGSKANKRINCNLDVDVLFLDLKLHYDFYDFRYLRNKIASCNKQLCCKLGKLVLEKKCNSRFSHYSVFYDIILDLCNHFRFRELNFDQFYSKKKPRVNENVEYVSFRLKNKRIEDVKLGSILNKYNEFLPVDKLPKRYSKDDFNFRATFSYESPIRSKVFNYSNINFDQNTETCQCTSLYSDFVDANVGHVVTGDLNIIKHRKLRNILSMGSKFRETISCSKDDVYNSIVKNIDDYIERVRLKHSLSRDHFKVWRDKVVENVRVNVYERNLTFGGKLRSVFQTYDEYWRKLQSNFIMCPVDKAGSNIAFVCKKFYIERILTELERTPTYEEVTEREDDILKRHIEFCNKFNIKISDKDKNLPNIYMMPKFHKNPTSFRFISASIGSSLKFLAKLLTPILKSVQCELKKKVNFECKFKDTSGFWISDNSEFLRSNLNFLSNSRTAKRVDCYDFKTLYTNIPHDDLFDKICSLLDIIFDSKSVAFVKVSENLKNVSWSQGFKNNGFCLTKNEVKEILRFLLDNIFVKFKGKIYRQIIGVPMGCDCAPFLANLYLFFYEYKYVSELMSVDSRLKSFFKYNCRYIDDLCTPNGIENFDEVCKEIYPECMILERTNLCSQNVTFLDLNISVEDNKFTTQLYDKRNDFDFKVISMPNLKSNVPERRSYDVFYSQLFRLCNANTSLQGFIKDVKALKDKLLHQNFKIDLLNKYIKKFINAKPPCTYKYWAVLDFRLFL